MNKKFHLACDEHTRFWWKKADPEKTQLVTSQIWRGVDPNYDDSPYEYGNSLKISKAFLQDILRSEGKTLIVCVEIERKNVGYSSKSQREYEEPYFRIFAINADGTVYSL